MVDAGENQSVRSGFPESVGGEYAVGQDGAVAGEGGGDGVGARGGQVEMDAGFGRRGHGGCGSSVRGVTGAAPGGGSARWWGAGVLLGRWCTREARPRERTVRGRVRSQRVGAGWRGSSGGRWRLGRPGRGGC